jgi:hypothetical protein
VRIAFVMRSKLVRRAAVVMPEAVIGVTMVVVVMHGVFGRRRLLRESDGTNGRRRAYGKRSDDLRSQRHWLLPIQSRLRRLA